MVADHWLQTVWKATNSEMSGGHTFASGLNIQGCASCCIMGDTTWWCLLMFRKQVQRLLHYASNLNAQRSRICCFFCCCVYNATLVISFASIRLVLVISRAFSFQTFHSRQSAVWGTISLLVVWSPTHKQWNCRTLRTAARFSSIRCPKDNFVLGSQWSKGIFHFLCTWSRRRTTVDISDWLRQPWPVLRR